MKLFLREKKRVLYLAFFFLFALSIPITGYFLSTDRTFDDRGLASTSEIKITFTAEPELIRRGESSTLTWSVEGADSCVAFSGNLGEWGGAKDLSDSEVLSPKHSMSYSLSCSKDEFALTKWVVVNVVDPSPKRSCETNNDCFRIPPYEICFRKHCLRGDVINDGKIAMADFEEFKKDYIAFQTDGWDEEFQRSDFNIDKRVSMEDYGVFVNAYRLFNSIY